MRAAFVLASSALLLIGVAAPGPAELAAQQADSAAVRAADSAEVTTGMVDEGRKIFHGQGMCSTCHGEQLEGTAIAPTLQAHQWKDAVGGSYEAIEHVVRTGVAGTAMVSHPGGISDEMLTKVAAYVWAVSHEHVKP